jgi:hypothetical protein
MPIDPKPTYVANWNVTYQRQLFGGWIGSVSYLGNKTTHLWSDRGEVNPAIYVPGNCTAGQYGLTKPGACSTTSNTNFRRRFYLANPTLGAAYASVNTMDDGAVAHYNGLLLSLELRLARNFIFELHGLQLHFRLRLRRRPGRLEQLATVQSPRRLGSMRV